MKFDVTDYGTDKTILACDHYVSMACVVSDTGVTADSDGRKIVKAGTVLGGGFYTNQGTALKAASDGTTTEGTTTGAVAAEGVLFNDVDVTDGANMGALLVHGFISTSKIPTAPTATMRAALPGIVFVD